MHTHVLKDPRICPWGEAHPIIENNTLPKANGIGKNTDIILCVSLRPCMLSERQLCVAISAPCVWICELQIESLKDNSRNPL